MKRILSTLMLLAAVCMQLQAQQRSDNEMLQIAQSVLGGGENSMGKRQARPQTLFVKEDLQLICRSSQLPDLAQAGVKQQDDVFCVYGYADERPGFVVVSTDESSCPILGYSTTSCFSTREMPEGLRALLRVYAERQQNGHLTTSDLTPFTRPEAQAQRLKAAAKSVEPMLGDIAYDQWEPYNALCPVYAGKRCLTGCVATAMSQIMAYHQYPKYMNASMGNISYKTKSYGIQTSWNVSNTVFDWGNMLPQYRVASPENYSGSNMYLSQQNELTINSIMIGENGYVKLERLYNYGSYYIGDVRLLICSADGTIRGFASRAYDIDLENRSYYNTYHILPTISSSLPDGTYRLYVASKAQGTNTWSKVSGRDGSEHYLNVVKSGKTVTVDGQQVQTGYNDQQAKAIATLMSACAHTIQADFGTSSTSAVSTNAATALVDYMDYSDRINYLSATNFSSDGWHQYLQTELQQRPIIVSGHSISESSGHSFVIDGYRYEGAIPYYHVNWGWAGSSNGYFLIDFLKPSEAGDGGYEKNYGEDVSIISCIKPRDADRSSNLVSIGDISPERTSVNAGESLRITLSEVSNSTCTEISESVLSAWAVDDSGKAYYLDDLFTIRNLKFRWRYDNLSASIRIPNTLPTGNYMLALYALDKDHDIPTRVISPVQPSLHINTTYDAIERVEAGTTSSAAAYDLSGRTLRTGTSRPTVVIKDGRKQIVR